MKKILFCIFFVLIGFAFAAGQSANKVIVKFNRDFVEGRTLDQTKSIRTSKQGRALKLDVPQFDVLCVKYQVFDLKRVFRYAGKFEERHKKHDADLFYELSFDSGNSGSDIKSVIADFAAVDIIELAEEPVLAKSNAKANDPRLTSQWALYNEEYEGVDINVLPAWDITTGDSRVIVAVIDNCFQSTHEDLEGNIWHNPGEIPNGKDDDNNGYIDDTVGWNFINDNPNILPANVRESHGTHIGGIIAGRSNNGKGVAGIAGGWDDKKGVSLMVFRTGEEMNISTGKGCDALLYAADHGAAIAQCSWGGYENTAVISMAVNYFKDYGGGGAMKGGLIIAAAGNDNTNNTSYPAGYSSTLAVGSIDKTGTKSSFSNYGSYVEICAPGGDIMSCVPNSRYAALSGTSMACPMVSGVAALVLSAAYDGIHRDIKTPEWLKELLISTSIREDSASMQIGGLVNAKRAIDSVLTQLSNEDIRNLHDFNVSVYPNPAIDIINFDVDLNEYFNYRIYNISGQLLSAKSKQKGRQCVDISSYNSGAHIIIINSNNKQVVKTFIKK